ncbi:MAG: nucleotidyl transferase AbiEii/AbiGii toxin family protein [Ramlibacter sp.]
MSDGAARRPPTPTDITLLAQALHDNGVEYVLIGGAAMALHGFPRMTRDIDLFLPVDPDNNARLRRALQSVPNSQAALGRLKPEFMDQGYSTAFEGDIAIDLLYVAADKTFADLRPHVRRIDLDGVPVSTLDIEGMLMSKRTTRPSDVSDRLKLERLRDALFDVERQRRVDALDGLRGDGSPTVRYFAQAVGARRTGNETVADWAALDEQMLAAGRSNAQIDVRDLAEVLCRHSPGAIYPSRQAVLRQQAAALAGGGPDSELLKTPGAGKAQIRLTF